MLDAKIATALNKILTITYYKNMVHLEEQKTQKANRFLRGRQFAYMIYENIRITGTYESTISAKIITVLTRYRPIVLELI